MIVPLTLRSEVLSNHLALLCDSELPVDCLWRVCQHGSVKCRVAASAHRAALAVEEGQLYSVLRSDLHHLLLTLILCPACSQPAGILSGITVPNLRER